MKKRILSILLAVMMVVPMLTMAIPVSAAGVSNNYSYKFEETDARNFVEGQVVDIGALGEAETAPAMDGTLTNYQVEKVFQASASDKKTTYMSIKDGYLYFAFVANELEGVVLENNEFKTKPYSDSFHARVQYNIGVAQWHTSDVLLSRQRVWMNADGGVGKDSPLFKLPKQGVAGTDFADSTSSSDWTYKPVAYVNNFPSSIADCTNFLVATEFTIVGNKAIYEAKFDIAEFYKLFAGSMRGEDIYDTPCLRFSFIYRTTKEGTNAQTGANEIKNVDKDYYAVTGHTCKVESNVSTSTIPATIIIPQNTLRVIRANASKIGAEGTDWRNAVAGQLSYIGKYATTAPVIDGSYEGDTYTAINTSDVLSGQPVTLKASITEDGYIYIAGDYYDVNENTKSSYIQIGLMGNYGALMVSKASAELKVNGKSATNGYMIKQATSAVKDNPNQPDSAWDDEAFGLTDAKLNEYLEEYEAAPESDEGKAAKKRYDYLKGMTRNVHPFIEGTRTYDAQTQRITFEAKFSLPALIALYEDQGWNTIQTNCIQVLVYNNKDAEEKEIWGKLSTSAPTSELQKYSFGEYTVGTLYPTFALPEGAIERFTVDNLYDFEPYGQKHVNSIKNTVSLDGVISVGEYGAAIDVTNPALANKGIKITERFASDNDYIYISAEVTDPLFKAGTTTYQWDIVPISTKDKIDNSDSISRINAYVYYKGEDNIQTNKPGIIWRTQEFINGTVSNTEQSKIQGEIDTITSSGVENFYKAKAVNDAETNTTVYEIAVSKSALRQCFGFDANYSFDSFAYFNYYSTNGVNAFSYLNDTHGGMLCKIVNGMAVKANGYKNMNYDSSTVANVVVNLADEAVTVNSASARISTQNAGLRFKTVYSDAYLAEMKAYAAEKGAEMKVGTLIAPNDYVERSAAFTHKALGAGNYVQVFGDVENAFAKGAGTTTIAGSIVNIKEKNLNRDFAGIGFIQIGDEYFYSDTYTVRNISSVANAALNDTLKAADVVGAYKYLVSEGVYSPYSAGQRTILGDLIAK